MPVSCAATVRLLTAELVYLLIWGLGTDPKEHALWNSDALFFYASLLPVQDTAAWVTSFLRARSSLSSIVLIPVYNVYIRSPVLCSQRGQRGALPMVELSSGLEWELGPRKERKAFDFEAMFLP